MAQPVRVAGGRIVRIATSWHSVGHMLVCAVPVPHVCTAVRSVGIAVLKGVTARHYVLYY